MLRQLWRQRGAYNVVNLPLAASQDEPGGAPGRADRAADWRRHYNPALEPEFREDVGLEAWDRPNWYADLKLSSTAAAKILRRRLEAYGPQKERSLQEVIARVRTAADAEAALKATELFRRYRSSREQHAPFKPATSKMIIERALQAGAGEVVIQALQRRDELGLSFCSLKAYRQAITHFSTQGDLAAVLRVFELAKRQGLKPNRDIAFCILRACLDCGRPDLAHAHALEFQANGLRVSPAQATLIEAQSGKKLPRGPVGGEGEGDSSAAGSSGGGGAPEASVSSTGEAEAALPVAEGAGAKVVPELAVQTGDAALPGASGKVAAAVSVEPLPAAAASSSGAAAAAAATAAEQQTTAEADALQFAEVPGLEAAVAAKMRQLFPAKQRREQPPELRRANSL